MNLKEIRKNKKITQKEAAEILKVSLRSYKDYENNIAKFENMKYFFLCERLEQYNKIDENNGILNLNEIKEKVTSVFDKYDVEFCYLFGSYAKNIAKNNSDVDLLVSTNVTGLDYFSMVEELRNILHKKVDLLKLNQLENNILLLKEILKDGIKIYG